MGEFNNPVGLTIDADSNVLVVDEKNYRVQIFTPKGIYKNKFGKRGSGRGEFMSPAAVATDSKRNIFVTDKDARIQIFDAEGYYLSEFGAPQGNYKISPKYCGIAIDAENRVYLTDMGNCCVSIFELKK